MPRPSSRHPTELELEILKILWRTGPAPARHVVDALAAAKRPLAYTSVVTVMNIMTRKGYLKRIRASGAATSGAAATGGGYAYKPLITEKKTIASMLRDVVDRAFRGSPAAAALNLLETSDLQPDELEQIRAILDRRSKEQRP